MKKLLQKLSTLTDTAICVLLVIVTLSKGGFYKEDIIFPVLLINILGVVLAIAKVIMNIRDNGIITKSKLVTILDVFVAILPISYALPLLLKKSLSIENSIFDVLRYTNLAAIYYIVRSSKNTNLCLNVLLSIACVVGAFGIDEITYRVVENIGLPIGYLERNNSVISSVVQYANIAAIIMLIGVAISIFKLEKSNRKIYKYLIVFLQIQILLTSSRMGSGLLFIGIIWFTLYYVFKKEISKSIKLCLSCIFSLISAGIISNLVENSSYIITILVYVGILILTCFYDICKKRIGTISNRFKAKLDYKVVIYACIIVFTLFVLCFVLPSNLTIESKEQEQNVVTRRTTEYIYGENELYLKIVPKNENTEFNVTVYQIYEDYKPEQVKIIDAKEFTNNEYVGKFRTTEGSKFVELVYTVTQGEICVKNVQINSREVTMSYMFIPDRLAFRIKDSLNLDLNNTLRLEYYKDALRLIKLSPIVGNGGEGFKLGYQMVQDKTYISSEVHSAPLQIAVEAGIIGMIAYIVMNILGIVLCIKMYKLNKNIINVMLLYILVAFNIMSVFDLTMSFAITSYILAVILGVIVNEYMKKYNIGKDEYKIDNKSMVSMCSIAFLCFCIVAVCGMVVYNGKIYKASLITLPHVEEDSENYNDDIFEKVVALENKIKLDKYNINYMIELDNTYSEYIDVLKGVSLSAINDGEKQYINSELAKYVMKQKMNVDNMIECEYYSKYALQQVASCYFNNYIRYTEILESNFESSEVAYSFYLGYALKLNERILEVGHKNVVANQMYKNMLEVYIENLSNQNKYIQSLAIDGIIQEMKQNIADYTDL